MIASTPESRRGVAASGSPAAAAPAAARLERNGNKSLQSRVIAVPCRCKSRFCAGCAPALANGTRDDLLSVKHLFRSPRLLTLTVDPKRHATAEAALDHVRRGEYIRKLMNRLGIRLWCWILEFQENGYPHWHVIIDVSERPRRGRKHWVDYKLAHLLWRKWGVGEQVDFAPDEYGDPAFAVMYISKYLTKPPRHGWPTFIYAMERAPRVLGMCRALSTAIRDAAPKADGSDMAGDQRASRTPTGRTVGERVSLCQESTMFVHESTTPDGEVRRRFLGIVAGSLQDLAREAPCLGVRFTPAIVHYGDRVAVQWLIERKSGSLARVVDALASGVERSAIPATRANRSGWRMAMLLGEVVEVAG